MDFVEAKRSKGLVILTLSRGKVNALNPAAVAQLREALQTLEVDREVRAIVLTGAGKFFSFGFDIPEFLSFTKAQFTEYLTNFSDLYTYMFLYPKPVVAALNGHAVAGGCMLALACDYRVMVTGKAKIALNEISFGSSVFAGSTEMLRFWVGSANATTILYTGAMYTAEQAKSLGLVEEVATEGQLVDRAINVASEFGFKDPRAFMSIKSLLRNGLAHVMRNQERDSIKEFADIWYSESTWANLKEIKIL